LGTIATFAFYQFAHSCGGSPLAIAIIEFLLILATLIIVSMFITRVAKSTNGLDALFTQDKDAKYASRWGVLYIKLKRETYWFFIPQYCAVVVQSAIMAFTQVTPLVEYCSHWLTESLIIIGCGSSADMPLDRPPVGDIHWCVNAIVLWICSKTSIKS
jgi:hypothetical protein